MEELRIVKVIHQEESSKEAERWMQRLIVKFLIQQVQGNPRDIGRFLKEIDTEK